MAPQADNKVVDQVSQTTIQELLKEKLRQAVRLTLTTVLEEEVEAYIQAGRYERTEQRRDAASGGYAITAMAPIPEIWVQQWELLRICQCLARVRASARKFSKATNAANKS